MPFRWIYFDILHFPSLPLLSFLWVNLQLKCSQANPQIQFHSYYHGSPRMALKVIFHNVKGNFLKSSHTSQHDLLPLVFLSAVVLIKNNLLYHQSIVPFVQSIRTVSYETRLGRFIMTFWLSDFLYCNPIFTRYECSIVFPFGNFQSIPAEISFSLLKSISHWRNFILVKTINCLLV